MTSRLPREQEWEEELEDRAFYLTGIDAPAGVQLGGNTPDWPGAPPRERLIPVRRDDYRPPAGAPPNSANRRSLPNAEDEFARAEYFVIEQRRPLRIPEGHERLTREAAAGLGLRPADLGALRAGVRSVDEGFLLKHFYRTEQPRHALRQDLCQPQPVALDVIRSYFTELQDMALRAGRGRPPVAWAPAERTAVFHTLGRALHLLQDSYSPAHVERRRGPRGGPHPILYIRYFGPRGRRAPREHQVFPIPDPRDIITEAQGGLTPWAAEAVLASREYLRMLLSHLARPDAARIAADRQRFVAKHLALSLAHTPTHAVYHRCRP